jgi:ASC-1-like (ASCH) protein
MPDCKTINEAVNIYYKIYSKNKEKVLGVLAIYLKKLK